MRKLDLGQIINTLANLGVIAGIIFLAVELNQNRSSATMVMIRELASG